MGESRTYRNKMSRRKKPVVVLTLDGPFEAAFRGGKAHPAVDEAGSIGEKLPPEGVNPCHAAARGGTGLSTG